MKTTAITATLLATLTASAYAQQPEAEVTTTRTRHITADPIVALPIGDAENAAGLGIGASATLNVPINPNLDVTGRLGFLYHLEKNGLTWMFVPIYGGVRYRLSPAPSSLYGAAEAGLTWGRASGDTAFGTVSDSDTELGGMLGVGYATPSIDVRGGFFFPDLGEIDDAVALMGSVSFRIADL
jgi:hypothetical protein